MGFSRLGTKTPGADPDYASSYESRTGGGLGATEYWGPSGWDIVKSKQLTDLRKEYGPTVENSIAQIWQTINSQGGLGVVAPFYDGYTNMAKAQDYFLQHEAPRLGVRDAHRQVKKNPMLY
jgi:hypothetical protein